MNKVKLRKKYKLAQKLISDLKNEFLWDSFWRVMPCAMHIPCNECPLFIEESSLILRAGRKSVRNTHLCETPLTWVLKNPHPNPNKTLLAHDYKSRREKLPDCSDAQALDRLIQFIALAKSMVDK